MERQNCSARSFPHRRPPLHQPTRLRSRSPPDFRRHRANRTPPSRLRRQTRARLVRKHRQPLLPGTLPRHRPARTSIPGRRRGLASRQRSRKSPLPARNPPAGLAFGFLTAREARPDLSAKFRVGQGGTQLLAHQPFLGRKLASGETLELDPVYLSAYTDPFAALEKYGDAAAAFAPSPIRRQPTALWCSWYAHRMAMTEDLVLANAAVAARHFKPLGFDIIQLDHGWRRGDITVDWPPNERFPHGLKWLADKLKPRHGFRLGLWIAPTDVAETSATFKEHSDWLLKDANGHPLVNWRWYWKPN